MPNNHYTREQARRDRKRRATLDCLAFELRLSLAPMKAKALLEQRRAFICPPQNIRSSRNNVVATDVGF